MSNPEAARSSFEFISRLASDGPDQIITADNFLGLVMVLDEFATNAGTPLGKQAHTNRQPEPPMSPKLVIHIVTPLPC